MKHRDFIREIANKTDTSQEKVDHIIDTALHSIKKLLANNDSITFHGFGKFRTSTMKARQITNPKTKQTYDIPQKIRVTFSAGKYLKSYINKK